LKNSLIAPSLSTQIANAIKNKIMEKNEVKKSLYEKLIDAVDTLPKDAVERTSKEVTRKGYDTTGYQYQYLVNVFNEVCGIGGWSFSYTILKETEGAYKSGSRYWEITVEVKIKIRHNSEETEMACVGGHRADMYADALKGAITNGFKKTAAFFGVGKKAYEGTIDEDYRPIPQGKTAKTTAIQIAEGMVCDFCNTDAKVSPRSGIPYCPNWKEHQANGDKYNIIKKKDKEFYDSMPEN